MNYFASCKTVNQVKTLYRELCFKFHPDVSGFDSTAEMQEINAQCLEALRSMDRQTSRGTDGKERTYYYNEERETAAMEVVKKLLALHLPEYVTVELIGSWVWVSGTRKQDTELRKELKALKLRWHSKRGRWYWRPEGKRRRYAPSLSFDDLRASYRSKVFENEQEQKRQSAPAVAAAD